MFRIFSPDFIFHVIKQKVIMMLIMLTCSALISSDMKSQETPATQQTEVIIPFSRNTLVEGMNSDDPELIKLQKQKLELEIEYLTRQLRQMDEDELRDLSIHKTKFEIEWLKRQLEHAETNLADNNDNQVQPKIQESGSNSGSEDQPTYETSKPALDENSLPVQSRDPGSLGGSAIELLEDQLREEQKQLVTVLSKSNDKANSFKVSFDRIALKRSAIQDELQILREEQSSSPNTQRQRSIEELSSKLIEIEDDAAILNAQLKELNYSQAKLLEYQMQISDTIKQLGILETNLKAIQEFRKIQEAAFGKD